MPLLGACWVAVRSSPQLVGFANVWCHLIRIIRWVPIYLQGSQWSTPSWTVPHISMKSPLYATFRGVLGGSEFHPPVCLASPSSVPSYSVYSMGPYISTGVSMIHAVLDGTSYIYEASPACQIRGVMGRSEACSHLGINPPYLIKFFNLV